MRVAALAMTVQAPMLHSFPWTGTGNIKVSEHEREGGTVTGNITVSVQDNGVKQF